jgi:hypothetical protein
LQVHNKKLALAFCQGFQYRLAPKSHLGGCFYSCITRGFSIGFVDDDAPTRQSSFSTVQLSTVLLSQAKGLPGNLNQIINK